MSDAITQALAAYDAKINAIAPTSVLIQLGFIGLISLVAILGFSALRPNNSVVYQPKIKYAADGKAPPKLGRGFFDWVKPVLTLKEEMMIDTIGLDAVAFLKFLALSRNIFTVLAILGCAVLIPVDVTYNLKKVPSAKRNPLSILTIQDVQGVWLWAHVAIAYVACFVTFFFVWRGYANMVELRKQYFRTDEYQNSLHARSLMITGVRKENQSDLKLAQMIENMRIPYPIEAAHIGRQVGILPGLIEKHNNAVKALEAVLTTYFKNPDRPPAKRPTMKAHGKRVDAIDELTAEIQRLELLIETTREQIGNEKAENFGFVSFDSVPHAHIVGKLLEGKSKAGSKFTIAPLPMDIIWNNLSMSNGARTRSKIIGTFISAVFLTLYTIPLLFVALLANLAALTTYIGFLDAWSSSQPFLFSAFAGTVPPMLAIFLQLLLPIVMRWIASYQGATTHSQLDRIVTSRYTAFLFFSQFFVFSLLGVVVQVITKISIEVIGKKSIGEIWANLHSVPKSLQATWVIQSTYWLTVFPLRGFSAIFDLAMVVSLIWVFVTTKLFGRTPREIREATKPPEFDYAVYWASHLLMFVVGVVYTPLAPLVPLFAAVAFAVSVWVYKYQLLYVFVTRVETGGRLWRVAINRMLFALIGMLLLMALTMGLQTGWMNAIALAPPMLLIFIFKIILSRKFDAAFRWYIPTEDEIAEATLHHADARKHRLAKRFGHPALHEPLFTPMLHKAVHHLLPTVYNGTIGSSSGKVDGNHVEEKTAGGLTFKLLASRDLAYDRATYLRGRDEDAMSNSTGTAFSKLNSGQPSSHHGGGGGGYFDKRRQEYLRGGTPSEFDGGDETPYEMNQFNPQAYASTEQLIPSSYSTYNPTPPPPLPGMQRTTSNQSFDYGYVQQELSAPEYYQQPPRSLSAQSPQRPSQQINHLRNDSFNQYPPPSQAPPRRLEFSNPPPPPPAPTQRGEYDYGYGDDQHYSRIDNPPPSRR